MKEIFQRTNQYLLFAVLLVVVMYFGKTILIPIVFAALLAMLMAPLCRILEKKGFNRPFASLTCVLILLTALLGVLFIIGSQIAAFSEDMPKIERKWSELVAQTQGMIEDKLGVDSQQQKEIVKEQAKSASQGGGKGGSPVTRILGGLTSTIGSIVLTLVYTFLMIFNKEHFETFFLKLYRDEDTAKVKKVVNQITEVAQKYLTGRVMSIMIIAAMYSIGLSLVGIKNAILLAGVAAILTVIPYVGTVLGGLFPVFMALTTEDSIESAFWAAGVLFIIQTLDNYFIEPNIVGGEVNLSALTSIFSIIAGGLLWGVAGMILFLPLAGIVKIVCDHVEELKPIGHLIGEPGGQKPSKIKEWIKEKIGKKKKR
jgi:predicted PurR-regulated permease PerM